MSKTQAAPTMADRDMELREAVARKLAAIAGRPLRWFEYVAAAETILPLIAPWRPITTAPRDGQHILACQAGTSFGWWDGKAAPAVQTVVHWWSKPGEEGFYTSVNELEPQRPFPATHWKPLDDPALAIVSPSTGWRPRDGFVVHHLKCWPEFYRAVVRGDKPWELRDNDRDYRAGDVLHLQEWEPATGAYTGAEAWFGVPFLLEGAGDWLPKGKVIMSLAALSAAPLVLGEGEDGSSRICSGATPSALPRGAEGQPGWQPVATAPHACHVLASRFEHAWGEWIYGVVQSPPIQPFTHWMPLPEPPAAAAQPRTETGGGVGPRETPE